MTTHHEFTPDEIEAGMTRAEIALEPLDTSVRCPGPTGTVAADTHGDGCPPAAPEPRRSKPVVLTVPLYGIPCGVCHCPAISMDSAGSWSRIWHVKPTLTTRARYCDVGTPPKGGQP